MAFVLVVGGVRGVRPTVPLMPSYGVGGGQFWMRRIAPSGRLPLGRLRRGSAGAWMRAMGVVLVMRVIMRTPHTGCHTHLTLQFLLQSSADADRLDPRHPAQASVRVVSSRPFAYDPRLLA